MGESNRGDAAAVNTLYRQNDTCLGQALSTFLGVSFWSGLCLGELRYVVAFVEFLDQVHDCGDNRGGSKQ